MQIILPGNSLLRTTTKTLTLTGAANLGQSGSPITIFTVTGAVDVSAIAGFCTTSLVSAGGGTLALGVTGSTSLFIGATTATTLTTAAAIWVSTTATATGIALPATTKDIVIMANVLGTVATADITAGVLVIRAFWLPVSLDGNLV